MYAKYIRKTIAALVMASKAVLLLIVIYAVYAGISWAVQRNIFNYKQLHGTEVAMTMKERERQLQCLAQNIYWEAASEPFEGKVAVAQVTINRANHTKFPNDICRVVYQKTVFMDKIVCQFSWFCEGNYKIKAVHKPFYEESEAVARKVLLEGFRLDGLKDAIYYHADYVNPKWNKEKVAVIGRHIFYKE